MNEQLTSLLSANKGRWMGETEIVRAMYPGRRDSQISDGEWSSVIRALRATGAKSRNIGFNEFVWKAR